jgi:hypothetical protein
MILSASQVHSSGFAAGKSLLGESGEWSVELIACVKGSKTYD